MCTQSPRRFPSKACNLTFGGVDADMPDEAMGNTYTFISLWRPKQLQANRVILSEYRRAPENSEDKILTGRTPQRMVKGATIIEFK